MDGDKKNLILRTLSEEQLEDLLRAQGKKLGFLIAKSTLEEEAKIELISLAEKMNVEDLERLINIFEARFVDEITFEIDDMFAIEIKGVVDSYISEQKQNVEELVKQVKSIE